MAMPHSFYEELGVAHDATPEEIKKAFQSLARQHHPDVVGGDGEKFKLVSRAYDVLSDPDKRDRYDHELEIASEQIVPWPMRDDRWMDGTLYVVFDGPVSQQGGQPNFQQVFFEAMRAMEEQQAADREVVLRSFYRKLRVLHIARNVSYATVGVLAVLLIWRMFQVGVEGVAFQAASQPGVISALPISLMISGLVMSIAVFAILRFTLSLVWSSQDRFYAPLLVLLSEVNKLQKPFVYLGVVGGLFVGHMFF